MKKSRLLVLLLALCVSVATHAQFSGILGTVTDDSGEPIIGATVVEKGNAQNATITNIDGQFSIKVAEGKTLVISYIGYTTREVAAKEKMTIVLQEDQTTLDEVVVVGYGVQKKSVVTASIAKVSAEDLENKAAVRVDNALKGLAAGVQVTSSSGQPGSYGRIRIRGNGTINNSDPLIIVDGMPMGQNGLDVVNPNDIESIEVLKDAASGAIYGSRAANGVIMVTTKRGKQGKAQISYNASFGWQTAWKHRDVTSATDYAILQNERQLNGGNAPIFADPYHLIDSNGNAIKGFGTDWQDLVFNDNAPVTNHEVSVSGASDKINYYLSLGYFNQDGIVGGNWGKSNYDRLTIRSNTQYNLLDATKERNFLNKLNLSVNVAYMRTHSTGLETNSEYGSVLGSALYLAPTLAPIALGETAQAHSKKYEYDADGNRKYELVRDGNGNPYTIPSYAGTYQEMNNPLAMLALPANKNWTHKITPNFSIDLGLWDNLKYHFNYSADLSFYGNHGYTLIPYILSGNNRSDHTSASTYKGNNYTWQIENTLTYDKTIGNHSFSVVLGQSALKSGGDDVNYGAWGIVNSSKPYLNYLNGTDEVVIDPETSLIKSYTKSNWGGGGEYTNHTMSSYFGRISYNYAERYMFQATVRRDGSSRFGPNNKWGTFPSFSLGWNVTNEPFFEKVKNAARLNTLKVRFSWGKNGNESIGDFGYTTLTAQGNNVFFGKTAIKHNGTKADKTANPSLKWEESEQTDFGLDFAFFNNALTFTVDYFIKKTNDMIIEMPIPSYVGETKPIGNVGDMENKGVEFELGYKWHIGNARFAFKGNASYLKNTLKNLGNDTGYLEYDGIQGFSSRIARGENGKAWPFFYGFKTNGILQNQADVDAYIASLPNGNEVQGSIEPGDVRFVDVNGDGRLTPDDRTDIGNGTPKWTYGLNLNAEWMGFDFNVFFQGVAGNKVFDATYRQDVYSGNYPTWMLGRWTGEDTSNRLPRLDAKDTDNWKVSDLYVYDGAYFRLKNISLGYTIPQKFTRMVCIERLRFYVMAENLATWTKYHGFDPEISSGGTSLGIDKGVYPQARTWYVGLNVTF